MSIQGQLPTGYQGDRYLRDRLQEAIDIPSIQDFLKDRPARTSQNLINRVANKLSDRPKTAGSVSANWAAANGKGEDSAVLYSSSQKYGGNAVRPMKTFVKNKAFNKQGSNAHRRYGRPRWIRGIKGCFVCKGDHRANEHHSREEVTKAVNRLKARQPAAFLSRADHGYIDELFAGEYQSDGDDDGTGILEDDDDEVDWLQYDSNELDEVNLANMEEDDLADIEANLAQLALRHGLGLDCDMRAATFALTIFASEDDTDFLGVEIDTGENRMSVMSTIQNARYCHTFGLKEAIDTRTAKRIRGIGGRRKSVGTVIVQVPFKDLGIVIDVRFLLLEGSVPTLLCLKDLYRNGLDISILRCKVICDGKEQDLELNNYFLVHNWQPNDMPFAYYTERELRTIHRTFGHPAVKTTEDLLRRAQGKELDLETRGAIKKLGSSCAICNTHAPAPRRFKLTVGTNDLRFNHIVQVDTMFIENRPVLHMVDTATHLCSCIYTIAIDTENMEDASFTLDLNLHWTA